MRATWKREDITVVVASRGRPTLIQKFIHRMKHRPLNIVFNQETFVEDSPLDAFGANFIALPRCRGPVHAIEVGIMDAKTKLVAVVTDDVDFEDDGTAWLYEALRAYNLKLGPVEGVVAINDGRNAPGTAAFPLMSREFYINNCFPSPYKRYFVDPEWTLRASKKAVYVYARNARLKHQCLPMNSAQAEDAEADRILYRERNPERPPIRFRVV